MGSRAKMILKEVREMCGGSENEQHLKIDGIKIHDFPVISRVATRVFLCS